MPAASEHQWSVDTATARSIQAALVNRIIIAKYSGRMRTVGGADVTVTSDGKTVIGGFAVVSWPDLAPITDAVASQSATFPYIPGLLSFREIPVLLEAWKKLTLRPPFPEGC